MIHMPKYNDKMKPIYSIIIVNVITLGGSSLISFFRLNDIILSSLFLLQIIAANNNQGFLNKMYSFKWRIIDCLNAFCIGVYGFFKYRVVLPDTLLYPFIPLIMLSCYAQSISMSYKDYILLVNIWHILVFNFINIIGFFSKL